VSHSPRGAYHRDEFPLIGEGPGQPQPWQRTFHRLDNPEWTLVVPVQLRRMGNEEEGFS